ncbi:MAG TPA: S-layer homology domain-containing protein [Thermoanaerobaculia bacterium]|jgi:hypothetical protein
MSSPSSTRSVRIALAIFGVAGLAAGDEPSRPPGDVPAVSEAYGLDTQTLVIEAPEFTGRLDSTAPALAHAGFFYFNSPGSDDPEGYFAPVRLPAGAVVTAIQCWVNDTSAANDVTISFQRAQHDSSNNLPAVFAMGGFWGSTGSLGYEQPGSPVLNTTIRYTDGTRRNVYFLRADLADDTALQQCRVSWHRTISAAPGVATFGDVSTDYIYFRAIEALAASGITGGCGSGNFCPNQNVTRGEMAAFLARALGLHSP